MQNLIRSYQKQVSSVVEALRRELGSNDLLADWHSGAIPQSGTLSGGIHFSFHGVGCTATASDYLVNFDFGPGGRHDGFDAWRLWQFARSKAKDYPDLQDVDDVRREVQRLASRGVVWCPNKYPSGHLFYLSSDPMVEDLKRGGEED